MDHIRNKINHPLTYVNSFSIYIRGFCLLNMKPFYFCNIGSGVPVIYRDSLENIQKRICIVINPDLVYRPEHFPVRVITINIFMENVFINITLRYIDITNWSAILDWQLSLKISLLKLLLINIYCILILYSPTFLPCGTHFWLFAFMSTPILKAADATSLVIFYLSESWSFSQFHHTQ